jgi:trans-aconitate methyltransferase
MDAAHVTAVDFCEEMLKHLQCDSVAPVHSDATTYCGDLPFDGLFSAGLLEFVERPPELFRNARKNTVEGGWFVVLMPVKSLLGDVYRRYHKRHNVDVRLFSVQDITELATRSGWAPEAIEIVPPFSVTARLVAQ